MENLIQKIAHSAEINEEKAGKALLAISTHVKEQFPLLYSIVDLILETKGSSLPEKKPTIELPKNYFFYN
jgi:hypothetical protein